MKKNEDFIELKGFDAAVTKANEKMIMISLEEYTRLKDIETRFTILKNQMLQADYCPIHHQIILGIEKEYKQKEIELIPLK